jgi:hypothetical protein
VGLGYALCAFAVVDRSDEQGGGGNVRVGDGGSGSGSPEATLNLGADKKRAQLGAHLARGYHQIRREPPHSCQVRIY